MKSVVRPTALVLCLISTVVLSGCGGGTPQQLEQLQIVTASLPNGTWEMPYSQVIQASGGVAPFTWSVSAGALPHNLSLSSSGNTATISGTPDIAAQGVAFTIEVADVAGQSATLAYTVSILLGAGSLTLSSPSLNFSAQLTGTTSGVQPVTLTSTSGSVLAINSITIAGTNAADFGQSNTCGSSLAAGANCTVTVTFTPSQAGPRSASITITDDTVGSPQSVSLNGVGLVPGSNATLSGTSLDFGTEFIGTTTPARSVMLSNYGTAMLSVASITASANFGETDNCVPGLASGGSCQINVTFTPSTSGTLNGTILVTDNAPGSPQTISITGEGLVTGGACSMKGQECGAPQLPPCCPGLVCSAASTRAFCE